MTFCISIGRVSRIGSQDIQVKCTAAVFFRRMDSVKSALEGIVFYLFPLTTKKRNGRRFVGIIEDWILLGLNKILHRKRISSRNYEFLPGIGGTSIQSPPFVSI